MKLLFDFLPVLLFFAAYQLSDIYVATLVAIASSFLQVAWVKLRHNRYEKNYVITFIVMLILGGATLYLENELFIKWKPTAINWLFALIFIGSHFIGQKTLIERMMGGMVTLPSNSWVRLNIAWTSFFILLGFANLYVLYTFDTETWVNFKLFGMFGLTFAFVLAQGIYIAKYMKPQAQNNMGDN